ncbi:MAG: response regulator [Candidatus Cloacimonetes bacterium]|nr:response regulator [Candidatus Cloacimonadota bacterium]
MITLKTIIKSTLIIDQEEYNNSNLKNIFREKFLHLDIVSPEHDYMSMIENTKYDCVMLDSELAKNQSTFIIDQIKGNYPWMIVVVLLKNNDFEKIISFVRLGVDDFIVKPFVWDNFEELLKHYFF